MGLGLGLGFVQGPITTGFVGFCPWTRVGKVYLGSTSFQLWWINQDEVSLWPSVDLIAFYMDGINKEHITLLYLQWRPVKKLDQRTLSARLADRALAHLITPYQPIFLLIYQHCVDVCKVAN